MRQQKPIKRLEDFNAIALSIATPEEISSWSSGEITKPETINYRTQKPEPGGLFCQRIFGPVKNWECGCGKYKRIRYKGIICEKCGVEVTRSIVRRERMGHIKLGVPVMHPWFLRSTPSKIGLLLDLAVKKIEQVVYFASYIVVSVNADRKQEAITELNKEYERVLQRIKEDNSVSLKAAKTAFRAGDVSETELQKLEADLAAIVDEAHENFKAAKRDLESIVVGRVLTETEYRGLSMKFGHVFRAGIGAESIREILMKMDLVALERALQEELKTTKGQKQQKIMKRLRLIGALIKNGTKPEHMVMTVIPVMPPDLRPMVQLDGGQFATSDLNDLYRRVINRNARLKKLIQLGAPDIICRNEKRMLQEAVDILIANSTRNSRAGINYVQKRKLKSLSDMLKGKQGRFRQNLLGKRVDFSGRSVIVIGPQLQLDQCGLPKYIALELFKPFVIAKLLEFELAYNVKAAERQIKEGEGVVWDILAEVIQGKYVLLNRAPTLHRLGIQAFQPLLVEGKAIQLHPLVCSAFNADFDGDQMAVHLPLSVHAQAEARDLINAKRNLLKPASGDPITNPSQDVVLGIYYMTGVATGARGTGHGFPSVEAALLAFTGGDIAVNALVRVRMGGQVVETTAGRLLLQGILPAGTPFMNEQLNKRKQKEILQQVYDNAGMEASAELADRMKNLGYRFATQSGVSISAYDYLLPPQKDAMLEKARKVVKHLMKLYQRGLLTEAERYQQVVSLWHRVKGDVQEDMLNEYKDVEHNDIYAMYHSGARGSLGQVMTVAGMKGLVSSTSGKTIELPVTSSMLNGVEILEYFINCYAGRKGKADTALKTAQAGYLTRRLVDSVQDVIVREDDCGTTIYREITQEESAEMGMHFAKRVYGRTLALPVMKGKKELLPAGTILGNAEVAVLEAEQVPSVTLRSVMFCKTLGGVCKKCYGYDLGKNKQVEIGTPVGIIAAQSIGEPGTQLTMRSFHGGGAASEGAEMTDGLARVEELFEARNPKVAAKLSEIAGRVELKKGKRDVKITITATEAMDDLHHTNEEYQTVVKKGDSVKSGQTIAKALEGRATLKARCDGKVVDVTESHITIKQSSAQKKEYKVPASRTLLVREGDHVLRGQPLTIGHINLQELIELTSIEDAQRYIMAETLNIYESQGQSINEKHIELIVKQMVSKVRIINPGESVLLSGEIKDIVMIQRLNEQLQAEGKQPIIYERLLLGLTRISLWTDSWLSAASFQETIRVLVDAAVMQKVDTLDGLKENVIIGRLIPAGPTYKAALTEEQLTSLPRK
ncbi:DNA-directed RNA polymerase subunit beta' [Candidatus Peribacteria bacterium]|nr:DNA-directed RNA polymerase subunit beta' [Candidatus Peribacteria bacterium]